MDERLLNILVEVNSAVGELAELSSLLDLCSAKSVCQRVYPNPCVCVCVCVVVCVVRSRIPQVALMHQDPSPFINSSQYSITKNLTTPRALLWHGGD